MQLIQLIQLLQLLRRQGTFTIILSAYRFSKNNCDHSLSIPLLDWNGQSLYNASAQLLLDLNIHADFVGIPLLDSNIHDRFISIPRLDWNIRYHWVSIPLLDWNVSRSSHQQTASRLERLQNANQTEPGMRFHLWAP